MLHSETCTSIINLRYQDGSEGSPSNPARFKNQDYAQLKNYCVSKDQLFVDTAFPPNSRSLGDIPEEKSWNEDQVKWLRPAEILKLKNNNDKPMFLKDGAERFDFDQGSLGDCWFLSAISSLTCQKHLMVQVVPMEQSFENYAGIFHFRFWRFGKWVDVVIDDYLPTLYNELVFVKTTCKNEFWAPLLEKAYAKVCGSYTELIGGSPIEAFKDFTGGVAIMYKMFNYSGKLQELWATLSRATECKGLICCCTAPKKEKIDNDVSPTGLVYTHAYSVTGITEVEYDGTKVKLVRVMNPWGEQEWNGEWSDNSHLWDKVNPADQKKHLDHDDGEFWMELKDFCSSFQSAYVCCENPNFTDGDLTCQWKCMIYDGEWVAGMSAGGSMNYSTFATNPQYRIQVEIKDPADPKDENILLSLMQKPQQEYRKKRTFYPAGLTVFKVTPGTPRGRLDSSFFGTNSPVNKVIYSYDKDVIELLSLEPGEYVIIPSTHKPYMTAEFVLTVYTKSDTKIRTHDDDEKDEEVAAPRMVSYRRNLKTPKQLSDEEDTVDKSICDLFSRYADQAGELSAIQLCKLLKENFLHESSHGFELEACRSMMAIVDLDRRIKMTFAEFSILWEKIHDFKKLFKQCDLNFTGRLSTKELRKALQTAGVNASDWTVEMLSFRYISMSSTSLEDFIFLMLRLDRMSTIFKEKSSDGVIHLSCEDWSDIFMYN